MLLACVMLRYVSLYLVILTIAGMIMGKVFNCHASTFLQEYQSKTGKVLPKGTASELWKILVNSAGDCASVIIHSSVSYSTHFIFHRCQLLTALWCRPPSRSPYIRTIFEMIRNFFLAIDQEYANSQSNMTTLTPSHWLLAVIWLLAVQC